MRDLHLISEAATQVIQGSLYKESQHICIISLQAENFQLSKLQEDLNVYWKINEIKIQKKHTINKYIKTKWEADKGIDFIK